MVLKVREPARELPGRTSYLVVAATPDGAHAGLLDPDERRRAWGGRLPPGATRQKAREAALVGARVLAIAERFVALDQRGELRRIEGAAGRVVVADSLDLGEALPFPAAADDDRTEWLRRGSVLLDALARAGLDIRRRDAARALARAIARISRRADAVRADLARIGDATKLAARAQWFVAEAARAPRGARSLTVTDWSTGEASDLTIPLDPARGAREQVDAMFRRAKRLKLGATFAEERLAQTTRALDALASAMRDVEASTEVEGIDEALAQAKRAAPRDVSFDANAGATTTKRVATEPRKPYRSFLARSGARVLVGKGGADNDALTLHVAKPHDLWLHAKDRRGAHVIVPLTKGKSCPPDDLVDAAHLAAHFSDARDDAIVDVEHTPRRYLRKPRGAAAGFVVVDREKVFAVRIDAARVRALLEREIT